MAEKGSMDLVEAFAAPAADAPEWDDAHGGADPSEATDSPNSALTTTSRADSNGPVSEGRSRVSMMSVVPSPTAEVVQATSPSGGSFQHQISRGRLQATDRGAMMDKLQSNLDVLRKEACPLTS